jgi:hypothetical protein
MRTSGSLRRSNRGHHDPICGRIVETRLRLRSALVLNCISSTIRAQVLRHYPMLAALPVDELDALLSGATYMKVPSGAVMFDEDQPCRGFPLLLSGSARVIKAAPSGRELHLYDVLPAEQRPLPCPWLEGLLHATNTARTLHDQVPAGMCVADERVNARASRLTNCYGRRSDRVVHSSSTALTNERRSSLARKSSAMDSSLVS